MIYERIQRDLLCTNSKCQDESDYKTNNNEP